MFGVVLWRDVKDGKAVFWCEDQGDLAYFENCGTKADDFVQFDAGDMVQFDVTMEQRLRRARNARLVKGQAYTSLPEQLRQASTGHPERKPIAKVVPFRPQYLAHAVCAERTKRKA